MSKKIVVTNELKEEVLYLVESAAQPAAYPHWVKEGYYTHEEYNDLIAEAELDKEEGLTPPLYNIAGTASSVEEAEDWLYDDEEEN